MQWLGAEWEMYDLGRRDGKENGKEGVLVLGPMEAYLG
jgi:hypothetical protein